MCVDHTHGSTWFTESKYHIYNYQYLMYRYLTASFRQHQREISTKYVALSHHKYSDICQLDGTSLPVLVSL